MYQKSTIVRAGINLMAKHHQNIIETQPAIDWFEVHPEHYFGRHGGKLLHDLEQIRQQYPIVLHGVGLSLGSTDRLDWNYLTRLKDLMQRFQPAWFSDHLSWASVNGRHFHDLLPLPYTSEAIAHISQRILQVQEFLGQRILVENISSYMTYTDSMMSEAEFIEAVLKAADCYLLLDINNLYVNSFNQKFDPFTVLNRIPVERVKQIHLAGYNDRGSLLIDTHGEPVHQQVWELYRAALNRFGAVPTLIEWESNVPDLAVVKAEADRANQYLANLTTQNNYYAARTPRSFFRELIYK